MQAQVLNLLQTLKQELGLTYLFISHDLLVIEYLSDRVLVMYLGQIMEMGSTDEVATAPLHPYTQALFASAPSMNPDERLDRLPLVGSPESDEPALWLSLPHSLPARHGAVRARQSAPAPSRESRPACGVLSL